MAARSSVKQSENDSRSTAAALSALVGLLGRQAARDAIAGAAATCLVISEKFGRTQESQTIGQQEEAGPHDD